MKVLIATPAALGLVSHRYAESVATLGGMFGQRGITYAIKTTRSSDLVMSRNYLASFALANDCTHVLFIDADMGFRTQAIEKMFAIQKPVVGMVCPMKTMDVPKMLEDITPEDRVTPGWQSRYMSRHMRFTGVNIRLGPDVPNGYAKAEGIGAGILLITCDAIKQILSRGLASVQRGTSFTEHATFPIYGFFNRVLAEGDDLMPEDHSFCYRWNKSGGEVWVVTDEPVYHVGNYDYIANYALTLPGA